MLGHVAKYEDGSCPVARWPERQACLQGAISAGSPRVGTVVRGT